MIENNDIEHKAIMSEIERINSHLLALDNSTGTALDRLSTLEYALKNLFAIAKKLEDRFGVKMIPKGDWYGVEFD